MPLHHGLSHPPLPRARLLDRQPGPAPGQPGGQRLVGALEPLGRHGDALAVRVPNAQPRGLNLHNLLAGRVGVGSCATLAWGKGWPGMRSRLTVVPPSPTSSGSWCRAPGAPGRHREPLCTHLAVTPGAQPALASAVSVDQAGGWAWIGERGLEFYLKMSSPSVEVCPPRSPRQYCALRSRGRPRQSFVGLSPLESRDSLMRCQECSPLSLQPWLRMSKAT